MNKPNIIGKVKDVINKVNSLAQNEKKYEQGQGYIGISLFDSYFLFNIFSELDGQDVYMDLTQVGNLYLNFFNGKEEVKIKNTTNVSGIDPKQGQVVFKITKENARKILGFTNNEFYISSKMQIKDAESDESVLYTGRFYPYNKIPDVAYNAELEKVKTESAETIRKLNLEISELQTKNSSLEKLSEKLNNTLKKQTEINSLLVDQNDILRKSVKSEVVAQVEEIVTNAEIINETETAANILNDAQDIVNQIDSTENISSLELEKVLQTANSRTVFKFNSKDNTKFQKLK
jgi:hypothetical protein